VGYLEISARIGGKKYEAICVTVLDQTFAHAYSPPPFPGCPGRGRGRRRDGTGVSSQGPRTRTASGKELVVAVVSLVLVVDAIWRLKLAIVNGHTALPIGGRYSKLKW